MTTAEMTARLREHGVELVLDDTAGRVRYRAPAGTLTLALGLMIAEVGLQYQERAAIMEYDGGQDRATAERLAGADVRGQSIQVEAT